MVTVQLDPTMIDHALTTTRGVRSRLDLEREVEDDVLLDCIDVAEQAPTGGNNGSRRWIIIRDQPTKDRMAELYLEAGVSWVIEAAERIEGTDHPNARMMQGAKRLGENLARVPALVIPTVLGVHDGSGRPGLFDSVIQAGWSFMVALRARGLGTVWTTMYLNKRDEVAELLGIPEGTTQICLFPVAYTLGTDFSPTARRYPAREIAYFDRYGHTIGGDRSDSRTLSDGPGAAVEADIKAPPHRVWEFVSDITVPARFSEEYQGGEWVTLTGPDETPEVGSVFDGTNRNGDREWTLPQHITTWEPGKELGWSTSDPDNPAARWRYTLEKVPGGTRLRHLVTLGPGPSGLTAAIDARPDREHDILMGRVEGLRRNMQATVDGIAALAEDGGAKAPSGFPVFR